MNELMTNQIEYRKYSDFLKSYDFYNSDELLKEYRECTYKNAKEYLIKTVPDKIIQEDGEIKEVSKELLEEKFIAELLKKGLTDYSAKDITMLATTGFGKPPAEIMSLESLKKRVRQLFSNYKENVYIKKVKNNYVLCVDINTAQCIINHPDFRKFVEKRIKRVEKTSIDTIEWNNYKRQCSKIEYYEDMGERINGDASYDPYEVILSKEEKTYLMIKALFELVFSEFDFNKYEEYYSEMYFLWDGNHFDERYDELEKIFNSPHFNFEFYKPLSGKEPLDTLTDKIIDRVAEKIVDRVAEKIVDRVAEKMMD